MPTKLTVGCVALAAVTCLAVGTAMASPLALNKSTNAGNAQSSVETVDYRCYTRHGRRYCRDTYDDDAGYYDYDGYDPSVRAITEVAASTSTVAATTWALSLSGLPALSLGPPTGGG
jgi:hypothetical protein